MDDETRVASMYMRDLYHLDAGLKSRTFHRFYAEEKKLYKKFLQIKKKSFYDNIIERSSNAARAAWSIINSYKNNNNEKSNNSIKLKNNNGDLITNPINIAEQFNNHFISKGYCNASGEYNVEYDGRYVANSIFIRDITLSELRHIVFSMKAEQSRGTDDIPGNVIKATFDLIGQPLLQLVNMSLMTGTFPGILKKSKIIPIYRKGDKCSVNNYRPIALQNQFAKIFERVFYYQLYDFLEKNNVITPFQHGFVKNRSTQSALSQSEIYSGKP